jgi:hypothetical protein
MNGLELSYFADFLYVFLKSEQSIFLKNPPVEGTVNIMKQKSQVFCQIDVQEFHLRRQTRLTALDLIAFLAAEENPKQWLHMSEAEMERICASIKDQNLRLTLAFGIGIHHAGTLHNPTPLSPWPQVTRSLSDTTLVGMERGGGGEAKFFYGNNA